jgi:AcrR family transcriptional regulator
MPVQQRATSDAQKEARRQAILQAALALFRATTYEAVGMAAVADRAGIAKGTVYLYFPTKEALFLALQEQAYADWFDEVEGLLQPSGGQRAPAAVAGLLAGSLARRPDFTRLIAILHTVLEHNIDLPTALAFKAFLRTRVERLGHLLEAHLPFLAPGGGALLLLRLQALVIGLQHLSAPSPVVAEALTQPELGLFRIDFAQQLATTLTALLHGLEAQSTRTP